MVSVGPQKGMKQHVDGFLTVIYNRLEDPRIGRILLLGALMSFGSIWLQRSQSAHSQPSNRPTQSNSKSKTNRRKQSKAVNKDKPASITDVEPANASQISFSDSNSD